MSRKVSGCRRSHRLLWLGMPWVLTVTLQRLFPNVPSSLQEFVKDAGSYSKKMVDDLLDQITGGDHSRMLFQLKQVSPALSARLGILSLLRRTLSRGAGTPDLVAI